VNLKLTIALALSLGAFVVAGCGFGEPTAEGKISERTTDHLNALVNGEYAEACAQLSTRALDRLGGPAGCREALRGSYGRELEDAALDIDVDGTRATAKLRAGSGTLTLVRDSQDDWWIDAGFTVDRRRATLAGGALGRQLDWLLARLEGKPPTPGDVRRRFVPEFLAKVIPAEAVAQLLRQAVADRGAFAFERFAYPPTATQAIAVIRSNRGERGAVRLRIDESSGRIRYLELGPPPPPIVSDGSSVGRFDIGGRELFIRCTGSGGPTVVFEGGLTEDWFDLQNQVGRFTRVCSYDKANALWGRSDDAPRPRTAAHVVSDLHALLAAAKVPAPYVLAGHSNGGLFAQLYASRYPDETAGLVLIDAVHSEYFARRFALLQGLLPPAQFGQARRALLKPRSELEDAEQLDIVRSQAEVRAAFRRSPLRPMPLVVLARGRGPQTGIAGKDEALWRQLQAELARLLPGGQLIVAERSGHSIQSDQPELVVAAVRDIVNAVRES
jgi:pimeloyl-ACP methyl ester carboxylesterase